MRTVIQPFPPRPGNWECQCARCGSSADWRDCDQCVDGYDGHDCGDDCCCLYPEDNVVCQFCDGHGGDYWCMSSLTWCNEHPLLGRAKYKRGQIEWYEITEDCS